LPIINPWFFYWGSLCDGIFLVSAIVFLIALAVSLIVIADHFCGDTNFDKAIKPAVAITIIAMLLMMFVPSSKTLIRMEVAKNITVERIENVRESGEEFVDYMVERIMELKDVQ